MRIAATQDVPEGQLEGLARHLGAVFPVQVDEARTGYKAIEPPSWIALFEHVPTWAAVLGPSASIFLGEVIKEAAKDAYRNKAAIGRVLAKPVVAPLRIAAVTLARFRQSGGRTQVDIGAPEPDDHFGTRLRLQGKDEESIALELALFVQQCGALEKVLEEAQRGTVGAEGGVSLSLHSDGSMQVQWMDADMNGRSVELPPRAP